ncbi:MAG: response regulator [Thermodesulfobacteriota bacterium]
MSEIKVLLVDDEPDFMEPLTNRLVLRKLDVATAGNGADALALLERQPVDVVVLDVKMPGMSGLEVIRQLKKRHPLVEVIMLTGHANLEASIEGMEAGAFDYLLKPAQIDELVYKIQDAFQKKTLQEKKIAALKQEAGR